MKVRYLIKFTKESDIKFISHLDLMRTIQRIIKRSKIPVSYSKGFNPHMTVSIAQPLSVGMYSDGEYMDVELEDELDADLIKNKLNENAPEGIKIKNVKQIIEHENMKKIPQAMAAVEDALYIVKIKYKNTDGLEEKISNLLKSDIWSILKKGKSTEKVVNIKGMVKSFKYTVDKNILTIKTMISCGSRENLSARLLADYIIGNTENADKEAFVDIKREEMYTLSNSKPVPLYDL